MDVDLDHAGIGGHLDDVDARIVGRPIAFDLDRGLEIGRRRLDRRDELEVVLESLQRRNEHAHVAVAGLDGESGANRGVAVAGVARRLRRLGWAPRHGGGAGEPLVRALEQDLRLGQFAARHEGVDRAGMRPVDRREIGQRIKRQAEAYRGVARNKKQPPAPQLPDFAEPARMRRRVRGLDWQHVAGRRRDPPLELAHELRALDWIVDLGIGGVEVRRPCALVDHPLDRVFERRHDMIGRDAEPRRDALPELLRAVGARREILSLARDQAVVPPQLVSVLAPVEREGPARQRLAGIPFALAVLQEAARREAAPQPPDQLIGADALGRPERIGVPLGRLVIVDRHEGRLAAHGEADVLRDEVVVDLLSQRVERRPGVVGEREGHARPFGDAGHLHLEREILRRTVGETGQRRGRMVMRRRRDRQVPFGAQQAGGRIETDPAGAGNVDLGPGVQVGEVRGRSGGPVERLDVRLELDEIARHEPRRHAEIAQDLDHQPGAVAARARSDLQGLVGRLHAVLHARDVFHPLLELLVERDEVVHRVHRPARQRAQQLPEQRPRRLRRKKRRKVLAQRLGEFEREGLRIGLDEEVERIDHLHVGDEIDRELKFLWCVPGRRNGRASCRGGPAASSRNGWSAGL